MKANLFFRKKLDSEGTNEEIAKMMRLSGAKGGTTNPFCKLRPF
jgi:hypothetical protein